MKQVVDLARWLVSEARVRLDTRVNHRRLKHLTGQAAPTGGSGRTAVVFNASTRLGNVSLNAAYSLLTAWGLRQADWRVVHFVCKSGMSRCLLGSSELDPHQQPPCSVCTGLSDKMFSGAEVAAFTYRQDGDLAEALAGKSTSELSDFSWDGMPLGELVLPSLRWRMRRHHLKENETTLSLFREFIQSAYHVAREFNALIEREHPDLVLVFNGQMFPEAVAAYIAHQHDIYTITHETGYQPYTVFMSAGDATARKVYLSDSERNLTDTQNAVLDEYLDKRFEGRFSMGGIKFWQEMQNLPEEIERRLAEYDQVVPIFTNVIFDTSQAHANHVFEHMFAWLDATLKIVRSHPDTLFVLRAHPDELRPNSRKKSRETVGDWVERTSAGDLPNLHYIDPVRYVSSYELIRRAKFVLAYNSSIALESVLLGKPAVCAGWAWYADYLTVYAPQSAAEYTQQVKEMLVSGEVNLPDENRQMARSLVYYQNFRASLPFGDYLEPHEIRGYVRLKPFDLEQLSPDNDLAIQSILTGIDEKAPVIRLAEETDGSG
jgi:hypothetical protein